MQLKIHHERRMIIFYAIFDTFLTIIETNLRNHVMKRTSCGSRMQFKKNDINPIELHTWAPSITLQLKTLAIIECRTLLKEWLSYTITVSI